MIALADHVIRRRDLPWLAIGLFDHPAHLATAALLMPRERSTQWKASFLAGGPALVGPRATAAGMLTHFARDLAMEPGLPRLWPFRRGHLRMPYAMYASALTVLAAVRSRPG